LKNKKTWTSCSGWW